MTPKEWKDVGIRPSLGREWQIVMDGLWIIAQNEFKDKAKNVDNSIRIGKWRIYANFMNNQYIEVHAEYKEEDRISIRHTDQNLTSILICVFEVVKNTYKNPLK